MQEWYYIRNGQQQGPITFAELQQMAASGAVGVNDLVWKQGMGDWVKSTAVNGLMPAGGTPAPMPQPAYAQHYAGGGSMPAPGVGYYSASARTDVNLTGYGLDMLRQTKPWARFVGIMGFVFAGLMMIGGLGMLIASGNMGRRDASLFMMQGTMFLVMGGLYIVPSIFLNGYASKIAQLLSAPHDQNLTQALEAQKSFWKFVGIMTLIGLILLVLAFLLGIIAAAMR